MTPIKQIWPGGTKVIKVAVYSWIVGFYEFFKNHSISIEYKDILKRKQSIVSFDIIKH